MCILKRQKCLFTSDSFANCQLAWSLTYCERWQSEVNSKYFSSVTSLWRSIIPTRWTDSPQPRAIDTCSQGYQNSNFVISHRNPIKWPLKIIVSSRRLFSEVTWRGNIKNEKDMDWNEWLTRGYLLPIVHTLSWERSSQDPPNPSFHKIMFTNTASHWYLPISFLE